MWKWKVLAGIGVSILVVAGAATQAQRQESKAPTLTAMDYIQIHDLYNRYDRGCDEGNGPMIASAFTPDGILSTPSNGIIDQGSAQLAAHKGCHGPRAGPLNVAHVTTTIMIEPSPEGATGYAHVLLPSLNVPGQPNTFNGGIYQDVFVKGPQGWRIKKRIWLPSTPGKDLPAWAPKP